jgi:hypothetical protein
MPALPLSSRRQRRSRSALLLGLCATLAPAAFSLAQESPGERPLRLDYRLGFGIEHSDNVRRTRLDPVSETVLLPSLAFGLSGEGERFSLEAAGDAEFRDYRDGGFDSELRTRMGLSAAWRILPERLAWTFEDYLGRQPIDGFAIDRPDNQQRTNVLVTGPTLSLRPDPRTRILAEVRWIDSWAQRTREFNSDRWNLALRGLRQFSPTSSGSANVEFSDIRFERVSDTVQSFKRLDGFLRWDRRAARVELSADAGASRISFEDDADRDGSLLRLRASWLPDESQRLELRGARQYSDAVADLIGAAPRLEDFELPVGLPNLRSTFLNPDVYRESSFGLGHVRTSPRLFSRVDAYWREQDYARSDFLDQRVSGASVALSRPLRETLSLNVYASTDRREYTLAAREDRDSLYGIALRWAWLRNLELELGASRAQRRSDLAPESFDENRFFLGVTYRRD